MKGSGPTLRACALDQGTSTPDAAPDTGKEERGTPRPPEAVEEGRSGSMIRPRLQRKLHRGRVGVATLTMDVDKCAMPRLSKREKVQ